MCASTASAATPLCLDVAAGRDAIGTEIQLFGVDARDSQMVTVFDDRGSGGTQKIFWPACGRATDIDGQRMEDGTDIRLWDSWSFSDSAHIAGQTFDIYQTGGIATYGGKSYPKYKILCHKDNAYGIETYGVSPTSGDNVDIWHYDTADEAGRDWLFIPQAKVTDGVYTIRTLADTSLCLAVSGGSTAELAPCAIEKAVPDSSSQTYKVTTDEQGNVRILSAVKRNFWLGVWPKDGDDAYDGAGVRHTGDNRSTTNRVNWTTQSFGSGTDANGNNVPGFRLVPQAAPSVGYDLDASGGKDSDAIAETASIQKASYLDTQTWLFWPAEQYDASLGTPANVMGLINDGLRRSRVFTNGTVRVKPAWGHRGTWWDGFSIRYRTRSRRVGGSMSTWSAWRWDANGSVGNNGWGMPGRPSLESPSDADPMTAFAGRYPLTVTLSRSGNDRTDIEYEVRVFCSSGGVLDDVAHGPSATGTVMVAWQPVVRVTGVAMTPTGLSVMYESDHTRGGNLVRAEVVGMGSARATSAPASGSVDIQLSALSHAPEEGEIVTVKLWMWTSDGAAASDDSQQVLSYTSGHGATLRPTVTVYGAPKPAVPGTSVSELAKMTVSQAATKRVSALAGSKQGPSYCAVASGYPSGTEFYLVIRRGHGDRLAKVDPSRILPPLGVEWQLFATYRSGSSWATWLGSFGAIKARGWLVDEVDGSNGVEIWVNEGEGPQFAPTYEPDVTTHVTTGRERPVVTRGQTVKATWSLDGWLGITDPESERSQADWLAHAGKVTFRSPVGFWSNAYVTDCKLDLSRRVGGTVSASFAEVE